MKITYKFSYTTKGGAHRYKPTRKAKINLGDIYLRGVKNPPKLLKLTGELVY